MLFLTPKTNTRITNINSGSSTTSFSDWTSLPITQVNNTISGASVNTTGYWVTLPKGTYICSGVVYCTTGYTSGGRLHLAIGEDSAIKTETTYKFYNSSPYTDIQFPLYMFTLSVGTDLYIRSYQQSSSTDNTAIISSGSRSRMMFFKIA